MNDVATTDYSNIVAGKTPADVIAKYVELRDKKKVADETFSAWLTANYTAPMQYLERWLLERLDELGVDSISGPEGTGTAYKKRSVSVTIADKREFQRHVIGSEEWELADWRANKTAIEGLVEKGEGLPPGVNYTSFMSIGIRRK